MFFIPVSNLGMISKCEIIPGFLSDHSFVELTVNTLDSQIGRGFWKFNNALLYDKSYLDKINACLRNFELGEREQADSNSQVWEHLSMNSKQIP